MRKLKKSKYLLRRISIVSVFLLIIWLLILLVSKGLNNTPSLIEQTENTQSLSNSTESSETSETSETSEPTSASEPIPLTESSTEESSSVVTTEKTTEKMTAETTKENISMDFTGVTYYIQSLETRYQSYYGANKEKSAMEIVKNVNMNLDFDFYGQIEKVDDPNALTVICNKYYQLPSDFTPEHLVSVPDGYYVADGKAYSLKQNALEAFIAMADTAKKDGLSLRIISAYRSNSYQANLYQKYKNNNGQTAADRFSARPGHSEHETGLAIDINDVAQAFENTQEFTWLSDNAYKFGYVLRYPNGMENVTGYMYEPWHYRYLGVEMATQLKKSGLTYDAYYAIYLLKR